MSIRSAVAVSLNVEDSYKAGIDLAVQVYEKLSIAGSGGTIGLLFAGVEFDAPDLLRGIREKLPIPIVGCTTASEANTEGHFEESASLLVITGEELLVGIGLGENLSNDPEGAVQRAVDAARAQLGSSEPALALIFPDCGLSMSADQVLRLLAKHVGSHIPVAGGLPGDGLRFKHTWQFFNDRSTSDSIPVVLLGGRVGAIIVTRSGWVPMGRRARATKVDGNVLVEIDGQPAGDYFKRYISNLSEPTVMASYPVALIDKSLDDEDGRHFVIRSAFFHDQPSGAVRYNGDIPLNAQIQLARGTQEDILNGARDAARTLRTRAAGRPLDALLCFSCAGRRLMLGLETKREIEILLAELSTETGQPPVVNGFYTYGEIGPIDSTRRSLHDVKFHNCTLVLCGIFSLPPLPASLPSPALSEPPPSFIDQDRSRAIEAENQQLKLENSRLSRALRRLEHRVELIDKVSRGKEQVSTTLYSELERLSAELAAEKLKVDSLITNMLPDKIAERLKTKGGTIADTYSQATVLFCDLVGFTVLTERLSPEKVVATLNDLFSAFDDLADHHRVEKIKTIGDAYMVAGGIPEPRRDHATLIASMALDMQMRVIELARRLDVPLSIRVGIHCGPVIAGVIGKKKYVYDLWGDTVNTAARLESHGVPGRIQVSEAAYSLLANEFEFEERGEVAIKDKGRMKTWFLLGRKSTMSVRGVPFFF